MTPTDLVQTAQDCGMFALGPIDHHLLTGAIEFVTACKEASIQPVIGLEIDLEQGPLQLLATRLEGWSNLCRLSSALALREHPEKPCSLNLLSAHSKDLIALSDVPQALIDIFPDRQHVALGDVAKAYGLESTRVHGLANRHIMHS